MFHRTKKHAIRHKGRVVYLEERTPRRRGPRDSIRRRWRPWGPVCALALVAVASIGGREWAATGWGSGSGGGGECIVGRVIDGDTVKVRCPGEAAFSARLLGFDTPEVFSPRCASERARGNRATRALRQRIGEADEVRMVFGGLDRYDRRLTRLYLDGADVSEAMIAAGLARPYDGGRRRSWCD